MFNALNRVREKLRAQRQVIAFGVVSVVTGIIFILWIISFFASIQNRQEKILPSDNAFGFDTFIDSFQEARGTVEKEIGAVQEQFNFISDELQKIREENQTLPLTDFSEDPNTLPASQNEAEDVVAEDASLDATDRKKEITSSGIEIIQVEN